MTKILLNAASRAAISILLFALSLGCNSMRDLRRGKPAQSAVMSEVSLRRELAQGFTRQKALELAKTSVRQHKLPQAARVLRFLIDTQPHRDCLDLQARALLARVYFEQGRLCDSVLDLRRIMARYPFRREWVESNLDAITRLVCHRAACLRTTADDRMALGMIVGSGDYPGPAIILAKVYEVQLNDQESARHYRNTAAEARRAIAQRKQSSPTSSLSSPSRLC